MCDFWHHAESNVKIFTMLKFLTPHTTEKKLEGKYCHYNIFVLFDILSYSFLKSWLYVLQHIHKKY